MLKTKLWIYLASPLVLVLPLATIVACANHNTNDNINHPGIGSDGFDDTTNNDNSFDDSGNHTGGVPIVS